MKKLLATGAVLTVAALSLTGCAGGGSSDEPSSPNTSAKSLKFYSVELPSGKNVDCIGSQYAASVIDPDCDWANTYEGPLHADQDGLQTYVITSPEGIEVTCVASRYSLSVIDPDCDWSATAR